MGDPIDTAIKFMTGEHNRLRDMRDQMNVVKRAALSEGRITDALTAEHTANKLDAQCTGINTGLRQLITVRDRQGEKSAT